jgi:hypothetical protein
MASCWTLLTSVRHMNIMIRANTIVLTGNGTRKALFPRPAPGTISVPIVKFVTFSDGGCTQSLCTSSQSSLALCTMWKHEGKAYHEIWRNLALSTIVVLIYIHVITIQSQIFAKLMSNFSQIRTSCYTVKRGCMMWKICYHIQILFDIWSVVSFKAVYLYA